MELLFAAYMGFFVIIAVVFAVVILPTALMSFGAAYVVVNMFSLIVEGSFWIPFKGTIYLR